MPSPDEHLNSTFQYTSKKYVMGAYNSTSYGGMYTSLSRDLTTTSVRTPSFKSLERKRWKLPVNGYAKHQIIISDPQCSWQSMFRDTSGYYDDYYMQLNAWVIAGAPQYFAAADDPSNRAIAKMLKQLSETKANTLVTAAEMHKTVDLVAKTATRVFLAIKAIRRGDFTGLTTELGITATTYQRKRFNKRYNKAKSFEAQGHNYSSSSFDTMSTTGDLRRFTADTWLEFSYGWKPLLKDVHDHAQALAELSIERQNVTRYVRGSAKTMIEKSLDSVASPTPHKIHRTLKDEWWVRFGVAYKLQNGELNTFSQLGIDNPMEVVWEVLPFSFVADWFIPIGDFLKSLTATTGLVFHQGFKSERRIIQAVATVSHSGPVKNSATGTSTWIGDPMKQVRYDWGLYRYKLTDFPKPQMPGFRMPFGSGDDYGLRKAASSIALLQSLFLSKSKARGYLRV